MEDRQKYEGWLISTNLFKRSLAVVGHYIVGQIIIAIILALPILLLLLIANGLH